jgi:hypothetical protein
MLTADVVDTRTTAFMSCFLRPPIALKRNSHLNPGVRVEGILRQSADVDDVDQRVKEYEQGRNQFTPDEDAHVIGDCIKVKVASRKFSAVRCPWSHLMIKEY